MIGATHLAVLGDVHGRLDAEDIRYVDGARVDAVLCVGDLAGLRWTGALEVASLLGRLRTPCLVMPGNHDGATMAQLGAEAMGQRALADRLCAGMEDRVAALRQALHPGRLCAFEGIDVGEHVHLVTCRPHSFGGPAPSFSAYLARAYGVHSLVDAGARLCALVDASPPERVLVFLAHNGPTGLGGERDAPFGRDFHAAAGDWGDPDLAAAVAHAAALGRRTVVIAGHMHHSLRGGGTRRSVGWLGAVPCVNAARVPRIDRRGRHHLLHVDVGPEGVHVEERWVHGDRVVATSLVEHAWRAP